MLYQLHFENIISHTLEFIAQREISSEKEMKIWKKDIAKKHPLPKDYQWFICNEKSKHFLKELTIK